MEGIQGQICAQLEVSALSLGIPEVCWVEQGSRQKPYEEEAEDL